MSDILAAFTLTGVQTAITAALGIGVTLCLAFLAYRQVKKASNRV